jgi:hypothetical protein
MYIVNMTYSVFESGKGDGSCTLGKRFFGTVGCNSYLFLLLRYGLAILLPRAARRYVEYLRYVNMWQFSMYTRRNMEKW